MQVNIHEAKSKLSKLAELARQGETVVIAKAGQPYLELIPYREHRTVRQPGRLKGAIQMTPDFDDTPEQVVGAFEGD